jgi:hypothetical protein
MVEDTKSIDFWDELEEAENTVQRWPSWQQRYDVGLTQDEEDNDAFPEPGVIARTVFATSVGMVC